MSRHGNGAVRHRAGSGPPGRAVSRFRGWIKVVALVLGPLLAVGIAWAASTSHVTSSLELSTASLNTWLPTSVSASRVTANSCTVSWTPSSSAISGVTYDVTDGTGTTILTGVSGTAVTIVVPTTATTPTVLARYGGRTSTSSTAASSPCQGFPDAPIVTATASTGQIVATWTTPAGNGGFLSSYMASVSPGGGACRVTVPAAQSCTFTGLTDGTTYTVAVTAISDVGTGPAGVAAAIPYPSTIMTPQRLRLWLDGADANTLTASSTCTGTAATGAVGCWKDKSGQGNNAVQSLAGNRPSLTTVNGFSVPGFDGSSSYLSLDPSLLPTGTSTGTVLAVAGYIDPAPSTSPLKSVLNYGTLLGGQARQLQKLAGGTTMAVSTGPNVSQGSWASTPTIIASEFTATSESIWSDGQEPGVKLTGMSNNTGTTYADVGSSGTPSQFWYGPIPEIVVFAGTLSGSERRTVEEYLARKWSSGITPSAVTDVNASPADGRATVSWTASPSTGATAATSYTVTATPSDGTLATRTQSCESSPCTVTGLTNGGGYTFDVSAVNANGSGPDSAATPFVTPYPALLTSSESRLWLDGADASTVFQNTGMSAATTTAGQPIAAWKDKSGQGNDVLSTGSAPTASTSAFSGRMVPSFSNQFLTRSSGFPTDADYSVYAVYRPTSAACTNNILSGDVSNTHAFYLQSSAGPSIWHNASQGGAGVPAAANTAYLATGTFTESSKLVSVDYDGVAAESTTILNANTNAGIQIGAFAGANFFCGQIAEVGVFDRVLTTAERRLLAEYLARKWSVPITAQMPLAVMATPGDSQVSVSFAAPAWNGGSSVTSYTAVATPSDATLPTRTQTGCSNSPCTVTGLTDGATYTMTVAAVNAVGAGPAATADSTAIPYPSTLATSGNVLWLDGADPATIFQDPAMTTPTTTAGQSIAAWKDKSGQGNNVLSAGSAPTADTTAFSELSPSFSGSQYLTRSTGFPASSDYSVFAVYRPTSTSCLNNILSNDSNSGHAFYLQTTAGPSIYHAGSQGGAGEAYTANTAYLATGTFTDSSKVASLDVDGLTPVATTLSNGNTDTGIQIGALGGSYNFCGQIAEVGAFNRVLTATERRDLSEYLARKWSVAITPPAPLSPSAVAGSGTATVSWTTPAWDGGSAITAYTVSPSSGAGSCTWSSGTTASCSGLTPGAAYTFAIEAVNAVGAGPAASTGSVTP